MLAYKQFRYKEFKDDLSENTLKKILTQVKIGDDWLKNFDGEALAYSIRDMIRAYDAFFKGRAKFPKFKSKKNPKDSFTTRRKIITENTIKLGKEIGEVKILLHSNFKPQKVESEITISKSPRGFYYASVIIEEEIETYKDTKRDIGIDLGVKTFAVTSEEENFHIPKKLWKHEARVQFLQKKLSRQEKGSMRYEKNRQQLAKEHEKVGNIRKNFLHNLSTKLIRENQSICLEDLNVKGMMANKKLARAIGRMGFYQFRSMLEAKAKWHGREIKIINRWYPSSKTCSACGEIKSDLKLSERTFICPHCGLKIDRDYNASINILHKGLSMSCDIKTSKGRQKKKNQPDASLVQLSS